MSYVIYSSLVYESGTHTQLLGDLTVQNPSPKRTKFAELASKRVNRAANAIRLVGNLSNRTNYEWNATDAKLIVKELRKAVKEVEDRFLDDGTGSNNSFSIEP